MPLHIVRNDITKMPCDAIVNAANSSLLGGGGVDGAIHAAAGIGLLAECIRLGGCKPGHAKATKGHKLPCKHIIHTVGPKWIDGNHNEPAILASCYRQSLALAKELSCESVAFPLISAGAYGYPREEAMHIAVSTISEFLLNEDMTVYLVVYDRGSFRISQSLMTDIEEFIDQNYVDSHPYERSRELYSAPTTPRPPALSSAPAPSQPSSDEKRLISTTPEVYFSASLSELVNQVDESFSQMLLRKIDEKGMTDAQCYKKANIDRKLFSKIRKDVHYKPSKVTAIAFAVALELDLVQTRDLLQKAGFALSKSSKFDIIIEYFIRKGIFDIYEINQALFAFDQTLLGG